MIHAQDDAGKRAETFFGGSFCLIIWHDFFPHVFLSPSNTGGGQFCHHNMAQILWGLLQKQRDFLPSKRGVDAGNETAPTLLFRQIFSFFLSPPSDRIKDDVSQGRNVNHGMCMGEICPMKWAMITSATSKSPTSFSHFGQCHSVKIIMT
jgi:hypothetical protein